jgi:type IV secretory pathway TrbD component
VSVCRPVSVVAVLTHVTADMNLPEYRPVYRALHRPLTLCGVDRRLFFLALLVGAATFNLFYSFLAGCLLFGVLYGVAWWSTKHDPQMLQILLRSGTYRPRYDAAKHARLQMPIGGSRW